METSIENSICKKEEYNEIILINSPSLFIREQHDAPPYPHLGIGYLSAYLRKFGYKCQPIDAKFEKLDFEKLSHALENQKPRLVGITSMTHDIKQAVRVAQISKKLFPEVKTVLGGPHATALPKETLLQFPEFDFIVFGEGEITLLELVISLNNEEEFSKIDGLAFRNSLGNIVLNGNRKLIEDIDTIPFPAWDLFPPSKSYSLYTARGCPFHCNFCMRVSGSKVRKRNPQNILKEMKMNVERFGATHLAVEDESFGVDRKQAYTLLDAMVETGLNNKLKWETQTRVDLVDEEFFSKLKAAGCEWLGFGVESGNETILKASGKGITLKKAEMSLSLAKKAGLETGTFFIIGHPYETKKTAWDTIKFAAKLNSTTVAFGIMVPYPGTKIYEMAKKGEGDYKIISSDWTDFNKTIGASIELKTLSRKQLEKLQLKAYLYFYLRNLRLLDFFKLLFAERKVVFAIIKKILGRK